MLNKNNETLVENILLFSFLPMILIIKSLELALITSFTAIIIYFLSLIIVYKIKKIISDKYLFIINVIVVALLNIIFILIFNNLDIKFSNMLSLLLLISTGNSFLIYETVKASEDIKNLFKSNIKMILIWIVSLTLIVSVKEILSTGLITIMQETSKITGYIMQYQIIPNGNPIINQFYGSPIFILFLLAVILILFNFKKKEDKE